MRRGEGGLPPELRRFFWLVSGMGALSFVYTEAVMRVLRLGYPYGAPVFFRDDRWFDFTVYHDRFMLFRRPGFWAPFSYPFTYPAPEAVLYGLLYKVPHALRWYLLVYVLLACVGAWRLLRELHARGVAWGWAAAFTCVALLTSWPLRTLLETANTEGLVALLAGLGVVAVLRERCWTGAALIGLAGSMKLYPFVLLGLLLSKRRYKEFAWGVLVAGAAMVVSLAIVGPTMMEAQRHINEGLKYVTETFVFVRVPMATDLNHSLFTSVKFAALAVSRWLHPLAHLQGEGLLERMSREQALLRATFRIYLVLAAFGGVALYFGWIRRLPMLNQLVALTVCGVVLPPLSMDYTLVQLLLPFVLLCLFAAEQRQHGARVRGLMAAFTCIAFVFGYQTYLVARYRLAGEVRMLALLALLAVVLRSPFAWGKLDAHNARV